MFNTSARAARTAGYEVTGSGSGVPTAFNTTSAPRLRKFATWLAASSIVILAAAGCSSAGSETKSEDSADTPSSSSSTETSPLGEPNAASGEAVKIGLLNAEGSSALDLPGAGDAAEAAAAYANDYLGGLAGHKIEVIRCADKADGASVVACANKFVDEGVAAVVVTLVSTVNLDQFTGIILDAKIPYFAATASGQLESTNPDVTVLGPGFIGDLGAMLQWAVDHNLKSLGFMSFDLPVNQQLLDRVKPAYDAAGVTLEPTLFDPTSADYSPYVQTALSKKPDALVIGALEPQCIAIVQAARNAGSQIPVLTTPGCGSDNVLKTLGSEANGLVVFDVADYFSDNAEAQLYKAVLAKYAPGTESQDGFTVLGYQAMLGLVRAANAGGLSGDATPEAVQSALRAAVDVPTPAGAGTTFSCDKPALELVQSTLCTGIVYAWPAEDGKRGEVQPIDSAAVLNQ